MRRHLAFTLLILLTWWHSPPRPAAQSAATGAGEASEAVEDPEEPFVLYSDWFSDGVQQSADTATRCRLLQGRGRRRLRRSSALRRSS